MRPPGQQGRCASAASPSGYVPPTTAPQPPVGDHAEQLGHRRVQPACRVAEAVRQPEADHARRVRHQLPRLDRRRRRPRRHPERDQPAERGQRPQARVEHRAAGHLQHDVDPRRRWPPAARAARSSAAGSTATSAPRSSASFRFSAMDAVAMTRPAPQAGQLDRDRADPAGGGVHDHRLAGARWALVRSRCQAVAPCSTTPAPRRPRRRPGWARPARRRPRPARRIPAADEADTHGAG